MLTFHVPDGKINLAVERENKNPNGKILDCKGFELKLSKKVKNNFKKSA